MAPQFLPGLAAALTVGWLWGSFINQTVDRAPSRQPAPGAVAPPGLSILSPARSICLACGVRIPWHDNLPIFSYLWLGGRCRACGAAIGRRTLVMEVAMPLAFGGLFLLEAAGYAPLPLAPWGYLLLSWLMGGAARLAERRGGGPWFWLAGGGCGLGLAVRALGWP